PVFHSLGNFIFQKESLTHLSSDRYEFYHLDAESTVADTHDTKTNSGTREYVTTPANWQTVVPVGTMEQGQLKELRLYPVELGYGLPRPQAGTPELSGNADILHRLQRLSAPYGTRVEVEGPVGRVIL